MLEDQSLPAALLNIFRDTIESLVQSENILCKILGPSPAPLQKIKTLWRYALIVKSTSPAAINRILE